MSQPNLLYTTESIISAFGGHKATADWAGVGPSAISNWIERGIPPGWHYRIDRALRERGFEVHPSAFGYVVTEQLEKARLVAVR